MTRVITSMSTNKELYHVCLGLHLIEIIYFGSGFVRLPKWNIKQIGLFSAIQIIPSCMIYSYNAYTK